MKSTKRIALQVCILLFLAVISAVAATETYEPMPGPGKKAQIGKDYTAVYSFDKKPQMGMVVLNLEIYDKEGKRDSSLKITGDLDMPTMKGAHGSGPKPLQLNKKGDYLLALHLMMPGEWEVQLEFLKEKTVIHRGSIRFHV
jgi:nitrogen fixation protein FixH